MLLVYCIHNVNNSNLRQVSYSSAQSNFLSIRHLSKRWGKVNLFNTNNAKLFPFLSVLNKRGKNKGLPNCWTEIMQNQEAYVPRWLVANWSSIPSFDNWKGQPNIPALLLLGRPNHKLVELTKLDHNVNLDNTYMRMFKWLWDEVKERAKESTESRELRSISMTWSFALGFSSRSHCCTFKPLSNVRDGIMTLAPLSARTLAVSLPIPLLAPASLKKYIHHIWKLL